MKDARDVPRHVTDRNGWFDFVCLAQQDTSNFDKVMFFKIIIIIIINFLFVCLGGGGIGFHLKHILEMTIIMRDLKTNKYKFS